MIIDVQRAGPSTGMPTRTQQCDIIAAPMRRTATPSTSCCSPKTGRSVRDAAQAFDLADRLQTPIFVMLDLDIGMNHRLCRPLKWDDAAPCDRGKVMTAEMLEERAGFRPLSRRRRRRHPLPHLSRHASEQGLVLHRGTSRDRYARYTEEAGHTPTTCSGWCASSRPPRTWCRARCGQHAAKPTKWRDLLRLDLAGDGRGDRLIEARGISSTAAHPRLPVPPAWRASSPTTISCSWSSRTATASCA